MTKKELVEQPPSSTLSPLLDSESLTIKTKACENCQQLLVGPFCGQCGQEAKSSLKYFWVVILHLLDDIFSFDSRASRTLLPLLVRPAFLTNEYFSGRRVHYVPPLRLYLFISIVFFISLKFIVTTEQSVISVNDKKSLITKVKAHIVKLKTEQDTIKKQSPERLEEITNLQNDVVKFTSYLKDLNTDYKVGNNKEIINITRQVLELEFEQTQETLSEDKKARFDALITSRFKEKEKKENPNEDQDISLSDKVDSTVSFDFLSEKQNKQLNVFTQNLQTKAEKAFNSDTGPLIDQVISKLPQLMFILLPLFAVILKIIFMFSKRLYMEHLTVALHSHSFIFVAVLLSETLDLMHDYLEVTHPGLANVIGITSGIILLWIPIYLFIMQKRVYQQGYFFTFIKFGIIGTIYSVLIVFTGIIAVVWGIMGT